MRDSASLKAKPFGIAAGNPTRGANSSPQGVIAMHTPLLTVVVPSANPGVGTFENGARPAQTRKRSRKPLRPAKASRVRFSGAPPFLQCGAVVSTASSKSAETAGPHFSSLRSSTAEHPPDKRETVEHHHAEGPFSKTLDGSDR